MKIQFLKNHLEYKKGQTADVTKERANYRKLVGVAKIVTSTEPKKKAAKKTVHTKTKKK